MHAADILDRLKPIGLEWCKLTEADFEFLYSIKDEEFIGEVMDGWYNNLYLPLMTVYYRFTPEQWRNNMALNPDLPEVRQVRRDLKALKKTLTNFISGRKKLAKAMQKVEKE